MLLITEDKRLIVENVDQGVMVQMGVVRKKDK